MLRSSCLLDVACVTRLEGLALLGVLVCLGTLLPKANELPYATLCQHDVRLLGVLGCASLCSRQKAHAFELRLILALRASVLIIQI